MVVLGVWTDGRSPHGSCIVHTSPMDRDESKFSTQNTTYPSPYFSAASTSSLVNSTLPRVPILDLTSQ